MKLVKKIISVEDLLKAEISSTRESDRCGRTCDHHRYQGRNLRCIRRKGHEGTGEQGDAAMVESHIDYIIGEGSESQLISFDVACCEGETNGSIDSIR